MTTTLYDRKMALHLQRSVRIMGRPITYQRAGLPAFPMRAILSIIPRLESVDRGKFYGVMLRLKDFADTPLHSSVQIITTSTPQNGDTLTLGGVTYTVQAGFTDSGTPNLFARASTAHEAALNLVAVINADPANAGVTYSSPTVKNPLYSATFDGTVDLSTQTGYQVTIQSDLAGPDGDLLSVSEHLYGAQATAKVFKGGGPLKGDTVTIDLLTYNVTDLAYDDIGGVQLRLELASS